MFRNPRIIGALLWLFSLQVFAATNGGLLAQHLWLDIGTALIMFIIASYYLGRGLTTHTDLAFYFVLMLILAASAVMAIRFCDQMQLHWYNATIIMAGPQVFAMSIGFWKAGRHHLANAT
jgi:hypothetical protein